MNYKDLEQLGFSKFQLSEIKLGYEMGLSEEQISIYAKPEFKWVQMSLIRHGFADGLSMEQIKIYARPELNSWQMNQIYEGLVNGLSIEQIRNNIIPDDRKIELYEGLIGYLYELISDEKEFADTLRRIGFTDKELILEGLIPEDSLDTLIQNAEKRVSSDKGKDAVVQEYEK